jgi:hypothetical protein
MRLNDVYRVIVLSIGCNAGEQVQRMVSNPVFRHHASPVRHIRVVPECENPSVGHL